MFIKLVNMNREILKSLKWTIVLNLCQLVKSVNLNWIIKVLVEDLKFESDLSLEFNKLAKPPIFKAF